MASHDKKSDSKKSDSKKSSKSKHSSEIKILDKGPIYICELCHAMLLVPNEKLIEEEVEEVGEDENDLTILLVTSYDCPNCEENIIVSEEEVEESDVGDKMNDLTISQKKHRK